jgi:hypothetical protein
MTYVAETASVVYQSQMSHGKHRNFEISTAEEFIAAITQHIPPKGYQMGPRLPPDRNSNQVPDERKRGMLRPDEEVEARPMDRLRVLDLSRHSPSLASRKDPLSQSTAGRYEESRSFSTSEVRSRLKRVESTFERLRGGRPKRGPIRKGL